MNEAHKSQAAVIALALESFDDRELFAFFMGVSGWAKVSKESCAFQKALDCQLIKESGGLTFDKESTLAAAIIVTENRQKLNEQGQ